jgi:hypothetical protein
MPKKSTAQIPKTPSNLSFYSLTKRYGHWKKPETAIHCCTTCSTDCTAAARACCTDPYGTICTTVWDCAWLLYRNACFPEMPLSKMWKFYFYFFHMASNNQHDAQHSMLSQVVYKRIYPNVYTSRYIPPYATQHSCCGRWNIHPPTMYILPGAQHIECCSACGYCSPFHIALNNKRINCLIKVISHLLVIIYQIIRF